MKASGLLGHLVCSASVLMTGCFLPGQVLKATPGGEELVQARDSDRAEVAETSRRPPPSTSASPRPTPEPPPPEAREPAPPSPQAHEPALVVATPAEPAPVTLAPDTTEASAPPEAPPLGVYAYRETASPKISDP